jgi:putative ABC transport system substrate-binding protein
MMSPAAIRTGAFAQPGGVAQIGIVSIAGGTSGSDTFWESLFARLRLHGFEAGSTARYDHTRLMGRLDNLDREVAALVARRPDVIVTTGLRETRAAVQATSSIPIVMFLVPDAVEAGLVATVTRPGANLTGLNTAGQEVELKRLQLLFEVLPGVRKLVVLQSAALSRTMSEAKRGANAKVAAQRLGIEVAVFEHEASEPFDRLFATMKDQEVAGVSVQVAAEFWTSRKELAQAALRHRLPTIYGHREPVEEGGLLAYSPRFAELLSRAADFVAMILKGRKPADLPIELPTAFDLVVNLGTARALGLTIPASVLARADEVIE